MKQLALVEQGSRLERDIQTQRSNHTDGPRQRVGFVILQDFVYRAHQRDQGPLADLDEEQRERSVIADGEGGRAKVAAASRALYREGIRNHMTVARVRSKVGFVWVVPYDGQRVQREMARVASSLLAVSPHVGVRTQGVFWVGMSGCRFLGGESALVGLLEEVLRQAGYTRARVGVADTVIAARAAALHGLGIVPRGQDREALSALPLAVVPLERTTRDALWALGIRSVGAFSTLPKRQITARFGADASHAYDLACGLDARTIPLLKPEDPTSLEVDFEAPFDVAEPALFILQGGMDRLVAPHRARGFGVQCLELELRLVEGRWVREVRPADPITRTEQMLDMCRALLQEATLPAMMVGLRASVTEVAPAAAHQEGLWRRSRRGPSLDHTLMRLVSRLGQEAVLAPGPLDDAYLPEQIGTWIRPDLRVTPQRTRASPIAVWRLLPIPRAIEVTLSEGVPKQVALKDREYTVYRTTGPQRIETGWWTSETLSPTGVARDYWIIELRMGAVLSVFYDSGRERWKLQGLLD